MRDFFRWIVSLMFFSLIIGCVGSVTNKPVTTEVTNVKQLPAEKKCAPDESEFLNENEKDIYQRVLKIPYSDFEKNMSTYYKLWKMNPSNDTYRQKYINYGKLFYSKKEKYQMSHYLTVDSINDKSSIPLMGKPNANKLSKISDIPDGTLLKVFDYAVVKHTESFEEIWYQVEYCGVSGYVSEGWTDSIINEELVKIIWR